MNEQVDYDTLQELRSVEDEMKELGPDERKDRLEELPESKRRQFRQRHSVGHVEFSTETEGMTLGEATRKVKVSAYSTVFTLNQKLWDWYLEAR